MKLKIGAGGIPADVYDDSRYDGGTEKTTSLGEAYELKFTIMSGEFAGKTVTRLINPDATSPKSNIAKFFAALAGVPVERGTEVDDSDFIGCRYKILVGVNESGYSRLDKILARVGDAENDETPVDETEASGLWK